MTMTTLNTHTRLNIILVHTPSSTNKLNVNSFAYTVCKYP